MDVLDLESVWVREGRSGLVGKFSLDGKEESVRFGLGKYTSHSSLYLCIEYNGTTKVCTPSLKSMCISGQNDV